MITESDPRVRGREVKRSRHLSNALQTLAEILNASSDPVAEWAEWAGGDMNFTLEDFKAYIAGLRQRR
jgi:hypothetical protein